MEIIKILKKDPPVVVGEREEDTGREGTKVVAKKTVDDSKSVEIVRAAKLFPTFLLHTRVLFKDLSRRVWGFSDTRTTFSGTWSSREAM